MQPKWYTVGSERRRWSPCFRFNSPWAAKMSCWNGDRKCFTTTGSGPSGARGQFGAIQRKLDPTNLELLLFTFLRLPWVDVNLCVKHESAKWILRMFLQMLKWFLNLGQPSTESQFRMYVYISAVRGLKKCNLITGFITNESNESDFNLTSAEGIRNLDCRTLQNNIVWLTN